MLLPPTSDAAILATASLVTTLIMDNQKNGQCGDVIHQEAVNGNFCPVCSTAMALWLSGHGPEAIMKLGRWRTQTFLTYIHGQTAELTRCTSSLKMRQPVLFLNVGG
jgi:hypothetical protein